MKNLLVFLAGAIVGAGGTLLWLRKDFNEKLEEERCRVDELEKKIDNNTEQVKKNTEKVQKTTKNLAKKARNYNKMCEDLQYKNAEESVSGPEALIREDRDDRDVEDDADDLPFLEHSDAPKEGLADEPYAISEKDFIHDEKEDFDKVTLFYYADDILAEEDGTVIEDPKYLVGNNWKDYIGKYVDDEAFVRNERVSTDYNIVCEDLRYSDEFGEE